MLLLGRKARIDFCGANVDASPHSPGEAVRTVWLIRGQRAGVETARHGPPIGKRARGTERVAAAHAVAQRPQAALTYCRMSIEPRNHQRGIAHDHGMVD